FFFYRTADIRDLHSFPTRRSSDLSFPKRWRIGAMRYGTSNTGFTKLHSAKRLSPLTTVDARYQGCPSHCCWTPPISSRTKTSNTDRKSTRLNSSHLGISYAVFCLK